MGKLIGVTIEGTVIGLLAGPVGLTIWAGCYIIIGMAYIRGRAIIANERR